MKKQKLLTGVLLGVLASAMVFAGGCNKSEEKGSEQSFIDLNVRPGEEGSQGGEGGEQVVVLDPTEEDNELPDGLSVEDCYRSELTNMYIDRNLENQRPIAVMVDNEVTALDHYGLNQADIVYELMNSTANGRVTRLMCIVKDWKNLEQFGSIRSTRPTNIILAGEYNAILIHDGGPFYINEYLAKPYSNNLSGGFARFANGKAIEFTEYVTSDTYTGPKGTFKGLNERIKDAGFTEEYNSHYQGKHFLFNGATKDLGEDHAGAAVATEIILPHPHNKSELHYNAETKEYEYKEYGKWHVDPLDDNKVLSFDNVILQDTGFMPCRYSDGVPDPNGYMIYDVVNENVGYYFTKGKAICIRWKKESETGLTKYYDVEKGDELMLNTGKTYISLIPGDVWEDLDFH